MQTLKTAAIVVLLMTVMYGAYVSLTTPPEPLPADVIGLLDSPGDNPFGIEPGLPEPLDLLGKRDANPAMPTDPEAPPLGNDTPSVELGSVELPGDDPTAFLAGGPANTDGVSKSFSDRPGASIDPPSVSDPLPKAASVPNYQTTPNTFILPDPNDVVSSFDPSTGSKPSAELANVAVTSGTYDLDTKGLTPNAADVQTAVLPSAKAAPDLGLANAIQTADKQYLDDKRRDALSTLSIFYNTPNLSGEQRSELLSRLDPLAREVIYSTRHLLEQPHRVGQNETLMDIAEKYDVPWQLLANINQIQDPVTILPGTELKVVRGPFRAEVNLSLNELTLFLGDLYAGRFPIAIGSDPIPKAGTYTVQDKQTDKIFYNRAGSAVPPGSPDNPYGDIWLDLGGQICIHGSPSTTNPTDKGCISLAADFADDLYGILSQGSSVTIRR